MAKPPVVRVGDVWVVLTPLPVLRVGDVWFVPASLSDIKYKGAMPGDYALPAVRVGRHWVTPFVPRRFIIDYAERRGLPVQECG